MKISHTFTQGIALIAALNDVYVNSFSPNSIARRTTTTTLSSSLSDVDITPPTKTLETPTSVAAIPKFAQRWRKRTKQLATLGPASSSFEMIETLFLAGADIFRLNFSHGSQEQKLELLQIIREVEEKYSHPIAVLGDLQGPKLRVSYKIPYDV